MTTIDLRPFYRTVREFDRLASRLVASVAAVDTGPAFDIVELATDRYAVRIAVPGWRQDELTITVENGVLVVKGEPQPEKEEVRWIQRGISRQPFERRFALAEHVEVKGARLENGVLVIDLARELPEALKPRIIPIASSTESVAKAA